MAPALKILSLLDTLAMDGLCSEISRNTALLGEEKGGTTISRASLVNNCMTWLSQSTHSKPESNKRS